MPSFTLVEWAFLLCADYTGDKDEDSRLEELLAKGVILLKRIFMTGGIKSDI